MLQEGVFYWVLTKVVEVICDFLLQNYRLAIAPMVNACVPVPPTRPRKTMV